MIFLNYLKLDDIDSVLISKKRGKKKRRKKRRRNNRA
jgi:hypothetical protein